ncbi:MAG: lysylphosphatidylglycerol synthase domain-containing protein [Haloplanus sp.]
MHTRVRFLLGVAFGGGAVLLYAWYVGVGDIVSRGRALAPWVLGVLATLVAAEGVTDGIGVWASVRPLGDGLDPLRSVQFALAGDFFDIVSPAGAASSEPIMARFISVATDTAYSEALGVRGVAKYVKAAGQILLSSAVGVAVLRGDAAGILRTLVAAVVVVVAVGVAVRAVGDRLARLSVVALTPLAAAVSAVAPAVTVDRERVTAAVDRFRARVAEFGGRPVLVALIVLGGIVEQFLVAVALWTLLTALGAPVAILPILVVVPLPQAATVVPVPASLGAYDLLLGGAIVVATGAPGVAVATAVLLFRTASLSFGLAAGGLCAALLRGWRPGA